MCRARCGNGVPWYGLGYLIVVVLDEDLYEQGLWPSVFESDHKASVRITKAESRCPASYDVRKLFEALEGIKSNAFGNIHFVFIHGLRK